MPNPFKLLERLPAEVLWPVCGALIALTFLLALLTAVLFHHALELAQ